MGVARGSAGRRYLTACLALLAVVGLAGCGGSKGLTESSTCKDFLAASQQDQISIVQQLAGKYDKPDYATPLGEPEVPNYCAGHPTLTLGQFFQIAQG